VERLLPLHTCTNASPGEVMG